MEVYSRSGVEATNNLNLNSSWSVRFMLWPPYCSERAQYPLNKRMCRSNIVNKDG